MKMKFDYTKQPGLNLWERPLKMDQKPLISIITAFYNAGAYFEQTYNCVMNQTFPWFEWIIVDDGSTDDSSLRLLEKLASKDPRIKILHQNNMGPSAARNNGINAATTEYVYILDADDLEEPTSLEYNYWALMKNPKKSWSFTASTGFQEKEYLWDVRFDPEGMKTQNTLSVSALIRKQDALSVGGYTIKEEAFDEDWHFWLKLMAKGYSCVQLRNEYLHWYRILNSGRMASIHTDNQKKERNKKIISEQAAFVINPKDPIIYPITTYEEFANINESKDVESIYKEHKKIHVLFVLPWLVMGGADKFNLDLITRLDKSKFEVSIITTLERDNDWLQRFREVTPEIFNLPNFLSPNDYPEFIDYFIKSREIDILFASNSTEGYYLLPWIRKNFPHLAIVDYVHMEEWYWRNGGHARSSAIMGEIVEKTYVCNSVTRDVMIQQFQRNPESVETVHIGIDEVQFDASKVRSGILYEELGISEKRPIVLFICRLHPQKRPFLMLKIAKQVQKKIKNVAFVVIGDGSQKEELISATKTMELDNTVYFLGSKNEVRPYYKDTKVTLICSIKEGLALTAYESCAMGVPVVSADVGGQKDLIDSSVGKLIPFMLDEDKHFDSRDFSDKEINAYTDAIVEILSDEEKWKELSLNCRNRIEQKFTIKEMVQYFENEFQRLIQDETLLKQREEKSECLRKLGMLADEIYTEVLMEHEENHAESSHYYKEDLNDNIKNIINQDREILERHEKSINHQWEIQKWHEERIKRLENGTIKGIIKRVLRKVGLLQK